jgi:hypothetical protein
MTPIYGGDMRTLAVWSFLALAALAPAMAASLSATAPSGVKAQVAQHNAYNKDCVAQHVVVKITMPPAKGTATVAQENKVVPESARLGGVQSCAGHTMPTAVLYYQSKPNFKGTDQFKYQRTNVDNPDDRLNGEVEITVTVN